MPRQITSRLPIKLKVHRRRRCGSALLWWFSFPCPRSWWF